LRFQGKMKAAYAARAKFSEDKKMALPGQHWSEKKLQDMTVRDWRIFREDFQVNPPPSTLNPPR